MTTDARPPDSRVNAEAEWAARQRYWRRKLGRLRLNAEPIEEQLARYRRVTLMLTAIPIALGLMFLTLFTAFRRPDVGAVVALVLFLPVVTLAWIDDALLRYRVRRYQRELRRHQAEQDPGAPEEIEPSPPAS